MPMLLTVHHNFDSSLWEDLALENPYETAGPEGEEPHLLFARTQGACMNLRLK